MTNLKLWSNNNNFLFGENYAEYMSYLQYKGSTLWSK